MGLPASCGVCGGELTRRTGDALEAELGHVAWVLEELKWWDADVVPPPGRAVLAAKYQRQEHVLRAAMVEPRERRVLVRAPPPPPPSEPLVESKPVVGMLEHDVTPTLDDRVVEEASVWHRIWRPFLHESVGWFIGGFLILVGTLYGVADAWASMSGTVRSFTVFGVAAAWTAGFAAWSRFLSRRATTEGAGRVLGLIAAAVAPLAPIALGPIATSAPLLFVPALLAWAAFVFGLTLKVQDDGWLAGQAALTAAVMGVAPVLAAPWLAVAALGTFAAVQRKSLVASLYLLALFGLRLHVAAPLELLTAVPLVAATALLLALRFRKVYPAYAAAYVTFQTCGALAPSQLKVLLAQVREVLGYGGAASLPPAYGAVYAAVFVVAVAVFAAVKLRGKARAEVFTATTFAAALVGALGLQSIFHDPRPALWAAAPVALTCLVLGPLFERRALSWAGAALAVVAGFTGGPFVAGPLAIVLGALSILLLRGHRDAFWSAAASLGVLAAWHQPFAGPLAVVVAVCASLVSLRYGRAWRPAVAAVLAVAVGLSAGLSQAGLAIGALTALLTTFALLPAVSVPVAVALATGATFFEPTGLLVVGLATTALALLEPKVKGIAWPASLSALALAPVTLGVTAWAAPPQLVLTSALVAASVVVWVRATRWPFFAVVLAPALLAPQLAGAPAWQLWLAVLAVVALTRALQRSGRREAWLENALCAGLAIAGLALGLAGHVTLLPFALGLALAAGQPSAWRIGVATAFALAVPGLAPLAAVALIALAFAARHSPRAARWVLGDEQRGWTVTAAGIASVACAALVALRQPAEPTAWLLLGGCLATCAVLLGFRWLLPFAVLAVAWRFPTAAVLASAALAALSRMPSFSAATLRRCAHLGRAFDGPLSTPLWLGAAAALAVSAALAPVPLTFGLVACALLLVTGVAWQAGVAVALAAATLALGLPALVVSSVLAATGLSLCVAGALLERRHAVGRVWHHAGWLLALGALAFAPGLHAPGTVVTAALAAAGIWAVAVRQARHEWLAWGATAAALHVGVLFAVPEHLALPCLGLATVALGALALQLEHSASRHAAGLCAITFGLGEVLGGALLLEGVLVREALVAAATVVLAVAALGRRVLREDDAIALWVAQAAVATGFVAVRWLGFHQAPGAAAAFGSLVMGAALGGLARLLPEASARAARTAAWVWPLLGLWAAPFEQLWVLAGLLAANALHLAVLARRARRFAIASTFAFNAALGVAWLAAGLHHPQYLLVAVGLSALALVKVYGRALSAPAQQRGRAIAVTLIYAAAAFEPLAMPTAWALWVCVSMCVLGVAAGIALKVRSYIFLGTGFLVTTVGSSLARYGIQEPRVGALLLSGLGLMVVAFMVLVTTRRSELLERYQRARTMLAQWEG
ncbi:MAG: hypothetical protein JNK82_04150 [Myxococcaceae bacterium]|nr:hypothetical protein [Myxococcaceae bacterium]